MAVVNSNIVAARGSNTAAIDPNYTAVERGRVRTHLDAVEVTGTQMEDTSTVVLLFPVYSGDVVKSIKLANDDLDTGTAALLFDLGLYDLEGNEIETGSGDVYADGDDQFQGASGFVEHAFTTRGIADVANRAWEDAGKTEDDNGVYYVGLKVATAANVGAAGTIAFQAEVSNG